VLLFFYLGSPAGFRMKVKLGRKLFEEIGELSKLTETIKVVSYYFVLEVVFGLLLVRSSMCC